MLQMYYLVMLMEKQIMLIVDMIYQEQSINSISLTKEGLIRRRVVQELAEKSPQAVRFE